MPRPRASVADLTFLPVPIIEVSKLVKEFGAGRAPLRALDEVSFAVDQGRFVTLVGPSGCGKSTLLQILAGLVPPSSGCVRGSSLRSRASLAKPA